MVPLARAKLRWRTKLGRMQAWHVLDVDPHEVLGNAPEQATILSSLMAEWPCKDLLLMPSEFDAWDALPAGKRVSVSAGTEVQLRSRPGVIARTKLKLGHRINCRLLEQQGELSRITWGEQTALIIGWVPSSAIGAPHGYRRSHRARPPRVRMGHNQPVKLTCRQPVDLWVELDRRYRVGRLEANVKVGLQKRTAKGAFLRAPEYVALLSPARLFVSNEETAAHCTVVSMP